MAHGNACGNNEIELVHFFIGLLTNISNYDTMLRHFAMPQVTNGRMFGDMPVSPPIRYLSRLAYSGRV